MSTLPLPEREDELVEVVSGQPELFSGLDVDAKLVQAAREHLHIHNAHTVSRDHQAVARIIAAAQLGWPIRRIAEQLGHSRHTVRAILRMAEREGKVAPMRERVLAAAAESVHEDIAYGDRLRERAEAGEDVDIGALAALRRSTWIGAGILADKGAARPAVEVNVQVAGAGTQVVVQEYAQRLRQLAPPESESGVPQPNTGDIAGSQAQVLPPVLPAGAGSAADAGDLGGGSQAQGEGGGVSVSRGAGEGDGKQQEDSYDKGGEAT